MSVVAEPTTNDAATDGGSGDYHYAHPTDPAKTWCGCTSSDGEIRDIGPRPAGVEVDCVVCLDLRATYGIDGWLALRDAASCVPGEPK